ncbi:helix-turn-helix domain-containing protein [Streptomyces sp. NPDC051132]|uniref:helix-turn-helix domain-containing protein n=1 Tax=unclassified Streptomyces TaxID=2593676 RepID=UPI00342C6E1A
MEQQHLRPGFLTAHQTARLLGVELDTVRQLVRRGRLKRAGGSPRQPWYAVADVTALTLKKAGNDAA